MDPPQISRRHVFNLDGWEVMVLMVWSCDSHILAICKKSWVVKSVVNATHAHLVTGYVYVV